MNSDIKILHIAPNLPPKIDGLGDYATLVAKRLKEKSTKPICNDFLAAINCDFAIGTSLSDNQSYLNYPPSSGELVRKVSQLNPRSILLHYVGYGYAKRGVPYWLLKAIKQIRKDQPDIQIGVMFHELFARGKPWQSSFWTSLFQAHITLSLANLSDFWMTNRADSASWLEKRLSPKPHQVLPIFSNVGELPSINQARLPQLIIFGSSGLRLNTYQQSGIDLFEWALAQGLEIHDIGPTIDDPQIMTMLNQHGVVQHGRLDKDAISEIMEKSLFGLVAYPLFVLAKSGVFAAYCAHGLCPIVLSKEYPISDGLIAGKHYLAALPHKAENEAKKIQVAKNAFDWYQAHSIERHADAVLHLMDIR